MAGTSAGASKGAATKKAKYGDAYFSSLGKKGGRLSTGGGFGQGDIGRQRASAAGRKGAIVKKRKQRD